MKTKRPIKFKEIYFTSQINSGFEPYELIESSINFSQIEFSNDVKEQMRDLDLSIEDLSKLTYLTSDRIYNILKGLGSKANYEEVKIIKKKLFMT